MEPTLLHGVRGVVHIRGKVVVDPWLVGVVLALNKGDGACH